MTLELTHSAPAEVGLRTPAPRPRGDRLNPAAFAPPEDAGPAAGVLDAVGQTPCVRLRRLHFGRDLRLFAKMECCNPGGSMKDRPSRRMVETALREGRLRPGMTVVESSSGNMAVGLAQACAYHGVRFLCVADVRTQAANLALVRAYGGDVEVVERPDPETGDFLTARLNRVRQLLAGRPGMVWLNQYANAENPAAHEAGTMRELLRQSRGLDAVFVATSTTGTLNGVLACVEGQSPQTRVFAVDSAGSVLFGGAAGPRRISGLGAGVEPPLSKAARPDAVLRVDDADCVVGCRALVRLEGVLAGGSGGGLISAIAAAADSLPASSRIGLILADHGSRYLSTVYDDAWVRDACGLPAEALNRRVEALVDQAAAARREAA